jgi:hypothetical protein
MYKLTGYSWPRKQCTQVYLSVDPLVYISWNVGSTIEMIYTINNILLTIHKSSTWRLPTQQAGMQESRCKNHYYMICISPALPIIKAQSRVLSLNLALAPFSEFLAFLVKVQISKSHSNAYAWFLALVPNSPSDPS